MILENLCFYNYQAEVFLVVMIACLEASTAFWELKIKKADYTSFLGIFNGSFISATLY
ncbi:hypothetical protein [Trichormus variabilis]|uniref:hypothetical protein n=1 Tax=Anabaena variabilis TaxID=264691 RepID=UPI00168927A7|nr:hypothetical protein [Trichormus variabilis]MBD2626367.1 hypothetical protein [Trichormus variabilis FACHB-164]